MGDAKPDITARALDLARRHDVQAAKEFAPPREEVDRIGRLLIAEWERVERQPVNLSYVATFADMARAVLADGHNAAPNVATVLRELVAEIDRLRTAMSAVSVGDLVTVSRCPHLPETEGRHGTVVEIDRDDEALPYGIDVIGLGFRWCAAVMPRSTP